MITITAKGSFDNTERFLNFLKRGEVWKSLEAYGQEGVNALAAATPQDTGETANSWYYEVSYQKGTWRLGFHNRKLVSGHPLAILLQYGHGTGTGGWVEGRDYINPVIMPLFNQIAENVWKAVTSA